MGKCLQNSGICGIINDATVINIHTEGTIVKNAFSVSLSLCEVIAVASGTEQCVFWVRCFGGAPFFMAPICLLLRNHMRKRRHADSRLF